MNLSRLIAAGILSAAIWAGLPARTALSCDIPVFRYALERWGAGMYDVVVVHDGPLSPENETLVKRLDSASGDDTFHAGYEVTRLDTAADDGGSPLETLRKQGIDTDDLPLMVLYPPEERRIEEPVWHGALTPENVDGLIDSPARREISRRIVAGDSAVWVFLESGDEAEDRAAEKRLSENLKGLGNEMKATADAEGWYQSGLTGADVEISFSSVTVSRDDPKEAVLVSTLMAVEPDLRDYAEYPMAFPVFGRGRALYALVGKGINQENIKDACAFVTGPCSCEAKALNPGVDLPIPVDWDRMLDAAGSARVAALSQPLVSLSAIAEAAADPENGVPDPSPPSRSLAERSTLSSLQPTSSTPSIESIKSIEPDSIQSIPGSASAETGSVSPASRSGATGTLGETSARGKNPLVRNMVYALAALVLFIIIWTIRMSRRMSKGAP